MIRTVRSWIGTLAFGAAAGIWSLLDNFHGAARTALAALAGVCMALALSLLIKEAREP
jgi:hypothetical protein